MVCIESWMIVVNTTVIDLCIVAINNRIEMRKGIILRFEVNPRLFYQTSSMELTDFFL